MVGIAGALVVELVLISLAGIALLLGRRTAEAGKESGAAIAQALAEARCSLGAFALLRIFLGLGGRQRLRLRGGDLEALLHGHALRAVAAGAAQAAAVTAALHGIEEHENEIQSQHHNQQHHQFIDDGLAQDGVDGGSEIDGFGHIHGVRGHEIGGAELLPAGRDGDLAENGAGVHGRIEALAVAFGIDDVFKLQRFGVEVVGQKLVDGGLGARGNAFVHAHAHGDVDVVFGRQKHGLIAEVFKRPVIQRNAVGEAGIAVVVIYAAEDRADKGDIFFVGGGHKAVAGVGKEAGFHAESVFIVVFAAAHKQGVGVFEGARGGLVGFGNGVVVVAAEGDKLLIVYRLHRNEGEVTGGGVVVGVLEAAGVVEVGILTAELGGAAVHLHDKGTDGAGDVFGQNVAGLVRARVHRAIEQVAHRQLLVRHNGRIGVGAVVVHAVLAVFRGNDGIVHGEPAGLDGLKGQKDGHDFGGARRMASLVRIPLKQHVAAVGVEQQHRLRAHLRRIDGQRLQGKQRCRKQKYQNKQEEF